MRRNDSDLEYAHPLLCGNRAKKAAKKRCDCGVDERLALAGSPDDMVVEAMHAKGSYAFPVTALSNLCNMVRNGAVKSASELATRRVPSNGRCHSLRFSGRPSRGFSRDEPHRAAPPRGENPRLDYARVNSRLGASRKRECVSASAGGRAAVLAATMRHALSGQKLGGRFASSLPPPVSNVELCL